MTKSVLVLAVGLSLAAVAGLAKYDIDHSGGGAPAAVPSLSLTVRSGSMPDTQVEAVNCDVYLSSSRQGKAIATSYLNGKVLKQEQMKETKAQLMAKIQSAKENREYKSYQPGAVTPQIKYEAFLGTDTVLLEQHNERGSIFNKSKEAEELQAITLELCHQG